VPVDRPGGGAPDPRRGALPAAVDDAVFVPAPRTCLDHSADGGTGNGERRDQLLTAVQLDTAALRTLVYAHAGSAADGSPSRCLPFPAAARTSCRLVPPSPWDVLPGDRPAVSPAEQRAQFPIP